MREQALPLEEETDLGPLLDRIGDARCVLIGEASHGNHEYYAWRAALTRHLIADRGFSFVAVEGDWPDCWAVHRSVTLVPTAPTDPRQALDGFRRWPTWMWANLETTHFCRWLREHNAELPADRRAGFYGLDIYSLQDSLRAITAYLARHRPEAVDTALDAYRCFEPYGECPQTYGRLVPPDCADEVLELLARVRTASAGTDPDRLNAWQNAEVATEAERYYRIMFEGGPHSWNLRDTHMADTLDRLLDFHRADAKAVVWAHNSHIGDARATDLADTGLISLGQLARERHGTGDVVLVGFAGGHGEVVAAPSWGGRAEIMNVPAPPAGSLEALLTEAHLTQALFICSDAPRASWLNDRLEHRAIGVVYDPAHDRRNQVPTRLGERYDALGWFHRVSPIQPLHAESAARGELETMPSGV
ncbi:erythromycin esterase family protein [Actinomadura craniellae]|uniref:Erythromycin esterase family protein n=2 Tax=Actinomadura craniellae TaxID=2231787 RepID=A0A365HAB3_9ACTN|nr:erythromycin esterase family protein [Actinomadura craniellae]